MDQSIPSKADFQRAYEGKPPWDTGKPQPAFVDAADQVRGSILDVGCGTGENALFFAERGHAVMGIDFLELPLESARRKVREREQSATFQRMDALELEQMPDVFDSAIDSGLFHVFADDDRRRYVKGLAHAVKPGGRFFLLCFSDREPPGDGPRRIAKAEIEAAFAEGWEVESIQETRFEPRADLEGMEFSEGGPYAWFCVIRRTAD